MDLVKVCPSCGTENELDEPFCCNKPCTCRYFPWVRHQKEWQALSNDLLLNHPQQP